MPIRCRQCRQPRRLLIVANNFTKRATTRFQCFSQRIKIPHDRFNYIKRIMQFLNGLRPDQLFRLLPQCRRLFSVDVLVLIANTPIRPRPPRISAIVSSCLRAIILGSFAFQGRFPCPRRRLDDDGPFWRKAYMLARMTFWSKGYLFRRYLIRSGIMHRAQSRERSRWIFSADRRK
jgi:hypothetical protein